MTLARLGLAVYIALGVVTLADAAMLQLKRTTSTVGRFEVTFPFAPKTQQGSVVASGQSIALDGYLALGDHSGFLAGFCDFPDSAFVSRSVDMVLDDTARAKQYEGSATLVDLTVITLDGNPGREVHYKDSLGKVYIGRMYLVEHRMYQLLVITRDEAKDAKTISSFFNSFRLLKR